LIIDRRNNSALGEVLLEKMGQMEQLGFTEEGIEGVVTSVLQYNREVGNNTVSNRR